MLGLIWSSIVDHIPLWGWMVIFGVPIAALLYFFYPILLPIWRRLPLSVRIALIGVGAGILAYFGGRYRGRANADEEQRRRDATALKKRVEVDHEVDKLSNTEAQDRLRDRWSRRDE